MYFIFSIYIFTRVNVCVPTHEECFLVCLEMRPVVEAWRIYIRVLAATARSSLLRGSVNRTKDASSPPAAAISIYAINPACKRELSRIQLNWFSSNQESNSELDYSAAHNC